VPPGSPQTMSSSPLLTATRSRTARTVKRLPATRSPSSSIPRTSRSSPQMTRRLLARSRLQLRRLSLSLRTAPTARPFLRRCDASGLATSTQFNRSMKYQGATLGQEGGRIDAWRESWQKVFMLFPWCSCCCLARTFLCSYNTLMAGKYSFLAFPFFLSVD